MPFETVIAATPRTLLRMGIFARIALPLKGGLFRPRALAMLAEVLRMRARLLRRNYAS